MLPALVLCVIDVERRFTFKTLTIDGLGFDADAIRFNCSIPIEDSNDTLNLAKPAIRRVGDFLGTHHKEQWRSLYGPGRLPHGAQTKGRRAGSSMDVAASLPPETERRLAPVRPHDRARCSSLDSTSSSADDYEVRVEGTARL